MGLRDRLKAWNEGKPVSARAKCPTGIPSLDAATAGGLPRGEITELFDAEPSLGKSSIALACAAAVTRSGGSVVYFDLESALSREVLERRQVDLDRIAVVRPVSADDLVRTLLELAEVSPDLVVIDSAAALASESEIRGEEDYLAFFLRRNLMEVSGALNSGNSAGLFLNQVRSKGPNRGLAPTGGKWFQEWSFLRIQLSNYELLSEGPLPTGRRLRVEVSERERPLLRYVFSLELEFFGGPDVNLDFIDLCLRAGVLEKKGSWIHQEGVVLGQGRKAAAEELVRDPNSKLELLKVLNTLAPARLQSLLKSS